MHPDVVGAALGLAPETVRAISTFRHTTLNPADAALAAGVRDVVARALERARFTIEYGPPAAQDSLVKAIVGRATGLIGVEQTSRYDEMRGEFEKMVAGSRPVEADDIPSDDDEPGEPDEPNDQFLDDFTTFSPR